MTASLGGAGEVVGIFDSSTNAWTGEGYEQTGYQPQGDRQGHVFERDNEVAEV